MATVTQSPQKKQITPPASLVPPIARARAVSSDVTTTAGKTDKVKKTIKTLEVIEGRERASSDGQKFSSSQRKAELCAKLLGIPMPKTPKEKKERSPEEIEARTKAAAEKRKFRPLEEREALKRHLLAKPLPKSIQILLS